MERRHAASVAKADTRSKESKSMLERPSVVRFGGSSAVLKRGGRFGGEGGQAGCCGGGKLACDKVGLLFFFKTQDD